MMKIEKEKATKIPNRDFVDNFKAYSIWNVWHADRQTPKRTLSYKENNKYTIFYSTFDEAVEYLKALFTLWKGWQQLDKTNKTELIYYSNETNDTDSGHLMHITDIMLRCANALGEKAAQWAHDFLTSKQRDYRPLATLSKKYFFKMPINDESHKSQIAPYGIGINNSRLMETTNNKYAFVVVDADADDEETVKNAIRFAKWIFNLDATKDDMVKTRRGYHIHILIDCTDSNATCEEVLNTIRNTLTHNKYSSTETKVEFITTNIIIGRYSEIFDENSEWWDKPVFVVKGEEVMERHKKTGGVIIKKKEKHSPVKLLKQQTANQLRAIDVQNLTPEDMKKLMRGGWLLFSTYYRDFHAIKSPITRALIADPSKDRTVHMWYSRAKKALAKHETKFRVNTSKNDYGTRFYAIRDKQKSHAKFVMTTQGGTPIGFYDEEQNWTVWPFPKRVYSRLHAYTQTANPALFAIQFISIIRAMEEAGIQPGENFRASDILHHFRKHDFSAPILHADSYSRPIGKILSEMTRYFPIERKNHNNIHVYRLYKNTTYADLYRMAIRVALEKTNPRILQNIDYSAFLSISDFESSAKVITLMLTSLEKLLVELFKNVYNKELRHMNYQERKRVVNEVISMALSSFETAFREVLSKSKALKALWEHLSQQLRETVLAYVQASLSYSILGTERVEILLQRL